MQYWEMGLPAYQIQTYQEAPLIMKSTYINQKIQICSWTGKHLNYLEKSQENLKKVIKTIEQPLQ